MSSVLVSPGVDFREVDLTAIIPAVPSTPGAYVGDFQWGPGYDNQLVSNEDELVKYFGKPNSAVAEHFFSAANFLKYSNALNVVRAINAGSYNANSIPEVVFSGNGSLVNFTLPYTPGSVNDILVKVGGVTTAVTLAGAVITFASAPANTANNIKVTPRIKFNNKTAFELATNLNASVYAKYPGTIGNSLKVIVVDEDIYAELSINDKAIFSDAPVGNEIHFAVIDEDGLFTGSAGELLELKEFLSSVEGTKFDDGSTAFYKDYINNTSRYVYVTGLTHFIAQDGVISLAYGTHTAAADGDLETGWDIFTNNEIIDTRYLIGGPASADLAEYVINLAEARRDCIALIDPLKADVVNNPGSEAEDLLTFREGLPSTSYAVMTNAWKYQFDKYNDIHRWVPLSGDIAGLCARTAKIADPWYSPAGINRGQIKNVTKLSWQPTGAERDVLFVQGINSVITKSGEGTYLFGDKTLLSRPSAFDSINVRMLFIIIEKAIAKAAKYMLFEFNDDTTRAAFRNQVNPYLRDIQGRRGIYEFLTRCDASNNTAEVIDSNEFVADIYIRPARAIRYIRLNFVATRTNVSFQEIIENNAV